MGAEHAAPDGFFQAPLTVTDKVEILTWSTDALRGAHGDGRHRAAHIFAEIDQPTRTSSCASGTRRPTGNAS